MQNSKLTRRNATVTAPHLPYTAYKAALALASELRGEIGSTASGNFKATFSSAKIAKKFADQWTADYTANRKVSVEPTVAPKKKPTASKGKTEELTTVLNGVKYKLVPMTEDKPSSTKKTTAKKSVTKKSKGKAFDYGVIKGKTTQAKNKALHKELVKMGLKDSREPKYMSIWNARPWAN